MSRLSLLLVIGGCAFLGGAVANLLRPTVFGQTPAFQAGPLPPAVPEVYRLGERFEAVIRRIGPTVVYVEATKAPKPTIGKSVEESGSGFLVRLDGQRGTFVLTNNHVIAQATPEQIVINLADGRLLRPVRVWADPESDVALLRLEAEGLPTAPLGNSDNTRVGQFVLAFGSPFGLNQTVTHGIISARERGQVGLGNTIRIKDFLQTDAAINPGSSGGPLVNLDGEVIGINTAIASQTGGSSGVAFSIPINLAQRVVRQLLETGRVARGYLGLQLMPSFEPADALRLGLDRVLGAWVEGVFPNTPAATAGVQANDVILQLDGIPVRNENHLINWVSALPPGQRIRLQIWRDRKIVVLEAIVGDWAREQGRLRDGP